MGGSSLQSYKILRAVLFSFEEVACSSEGIWAFSFAQPQGRAFRCKSSLRCGLSASIANAKQQGCFILLPLRSLRAVSLRILCG